MASSSMFLCSLPHCSQDEGLLRMFGEDATDPFKLLAARWAGIDPGQASGSGMGAFLCTLSLIMGACPEAAVIRSALQFWELRDSSIGECAFECPQVQRYHPRSTLLPTSRACPQATWPLSIPVYLCCVLQPPDLGLEISFHWRSLFTQDLIPVTLLAGD